MRTIKLISIDSFESIILNKIITDKLRGKQSFETKKILQRIKQKLSK